MPQKYEITMTPAHTSPRVGERPERFARITLESSIHNVPDMSVWVNRSERAKNNEYWVREECTRIWWEDGIDSERTADMQTFLPYPDFEQSARVLDYKRLGKQRVEAWQIMRSLRGDYTSNAWRNHPITVMWDGHYSMLQRYYNAMLAEWVKRGYMSEMGMVNPFPIRNTADTPPEIAKINGCGYPPWLGNPELHASHRAALLAKDIAWYGQFGWKEQAVQDYLWVR